MTDEPDPKVEAADASVESEAADEGSPQEPAAAAEPTLEGRLELAEAKNKELHHLALRAQADLENYRKRVQREREEERRFAHTDVAADLLSVLDNLERALAAAKQSGEKSPLVEGVALVEIQFLDALRRHHVARMDDLIGKPFDPTKHQALLTQPSAEHPPGTVVHVLKQGYLLHDRVLRPADVAVAAAPSEKPPADAENREN